MLRQIFKDSFVYGFVDAFFKALGLITFPFMAHALSVEEYGVTALAVSITGLLSIFFVGMHNAVQRYYFEPELTEGRRPALVTTGLVTLLTSTIFVAFSVAGVFYLYRAELEKTFLIELPIALMAVFAIIPSQLFTFAQTLLRMHFRKRAFILISAVTNGLNVGLTLYLVVVQGLGVWGFLVGYSGSFFLAMPLALYLMRKELTLSFDWELLAPLVRFAYPFIFVGLAYWLFGSMDRWMLGYLSDNDQVGLYSVAFKLTMVLSMAKTAFGQAWAPYAFKLYGENADYRELYARVLNLWYYILVFVGTGLFLFAPEFFMVTTPPQYWPAALIVAFTVVGMVMNGTSEVTAVGISLKKKVHYLSQGTWLSAFVNLVLNYLLIPTWGASGAAVATMLSYLCLTLFYLHRSQGVHPIPIHWKQLIGISLLLAGGLAISCIQPYDRISLAWFGLKSAYLFAIIAGGFFLGLIKKDLLHAPKPAEVPA